MAKKGLIFIYESIGVLFFIIAICAIEQFWLAIISLFLGIGFEIKAFLKGF